MIKTGAITYVFHFADGRTDRIELDFDSKTHELRVPAPREAEWTRLGFHRCGHCPLEDGPEVHCPFARALAAFVERFEGETSFAKARIEVIAGRRTITADRDLQTGLASLTGLVGATSGCPHLTFFRPMARFHLPFAGPAETLYRAFSTHLLGLYIAGGGRGEVAVSIDGLGPLYAAAAGVNRGMADRVRARFATDALVNALVILDTYAQTAGFVMEDALEDMRAMFRE